jgi:hypothetical protein
MALSSPGRIIIAASASITLDLKHAEGVAVLYKLLEDADVFLTNLLPAARRRMQIDVEDLRPRFPKLIYALGSGLGRQGPGIRERRLRFHHLLGARRRCFLHHARR